MNSKSLLLRNLFSIAVIFFLIMIAIAHFFVPPMYDWTQNTVSELAAQGHRHKWIMQLGFIGFGVLLNIGVFFQFRSNQTDYYLIFISIYGWSILMAGFFCTTPINLNLSFNEREATLHSLFATIAGIAMSLGIICRVLRSPNKSKYVTRLTLLMLVMGTSALFGMSENHLVSIPKGIVQRCLYTFGLFWLVYEEKSSIPIETR